MAETFATEPAKGSQIPVCRKKQPIYEEEINSEEFFFCQNCSFVIILHMVLFLVSEISQVFQTALKKNVTDLCKY